MAPAASMKSSRHLSSDMSKSAEELAHVGSLTYLSEKSDATQSESIMKTAARSSLSGW